MDRRDLVARLKGNSPTYPFVAVVVAVFAGSQLWAWHERSGLLLDPQEVRQISLVEGRFGQNQRRFLLDRRERQVFLGLVAKSEVFFTNHPRGGRTYEFSIMTASQELTGVLQIGGSNGSYLAYQGSTLRNPDFKPFMDQLEAPSRLGGRP